MSKTTIFDTYVGVALLGIAVYIDPKAAGATLLVLAGMYMLYVTWLTDE